MSTEEKIKQLKRSILDSHKTNLKFKIDEVLSLCDSVIEELMLLQLYNYFQNYEKSERDDMSYFAKIEFIEDEIALWDIEPNSKIDKKKLKSKVEKYNYRYDNGLYHKNIGFKVGFNDIEWISAEYMRENPNEAVVDSIITRELEIRPQSEIIIDGKNYRLDIALILNRIKKGKVIDSRKMALECDGYDYHSSPEQKKNDDIRVRKLKINGYKEVFRYSGSEIYRISDISEIHSNIEEIIKMLML